MLMKAFPGASPNPSLLHKPYSVALYLWSEVQEQVKVDWLNVSE